MKRMAAALAILGLTLAILPDPAQAKGVCAPNAPAPEIKADCALIPAAQAAAEIAKIHRANGGATYSLYFGNLAGKKLYAVSLYPERSVAIKGNALDAGRILRFIRANMDLLSDPRLSIGTWHDGASNTCDLDVSATLPDRKEALTLARKYHQLDIFDLRAMREIPALERGKFDRRAGKQIRSP